MSTLRTTHIQHPSSPAPNITLSDDGSVELPGTSSDIGDLGDVDTTGVSDGDVLAYASSTSSWAPAQLSFDLNDLSDVDTTGASAGDKLVFDGSGWNPLAGYLYAGQVRFESDGSFSKSNPLGTGDIGLRAVRVRLVGGGGGGAGSPATGSGQGHCGASGSGAAYAESFFSDITGFSASESVTVGSGGAGGDTGGNGSNGGASSFGALISANGGQGGFSQGASSTTTGYPGVSGQSIASGDFIINGGPSSIGICSPSAFSVAGDGGSSHFGGGAQGLEQFGSGGKDGQNAEGFGAGGSGSVNGPSSSAKSGGAGHSGIVIVDCYV